MATDLVGYVGSFSMGGQDIIRDVAEDVLYEDLGWSPITTFLTQINGTIPTTSNKFEWQESVADTPTVALTTAIAVAAAGVKQTVTFGAANVIVGNRYWHSVSKQTFQVTDFVSKTATTTTVQIVRVPLTSAAVAVAGTPLLVSLGNFIVEGGYYPIPTGRIPAFFYNYTQLCTRSVGITRTMKDISTYHGSQFEQDKIEKLQQFRNDQDRVVLFGEGFQEQMVQTNENGQSATGTSSGSKGIENFIVTNKQSGVAITEAAFDTFLATKVWGNRNSGSYTKLAICGPGMIQAINGFAKNRLQTHEGAEEYGLDIAVYVGWAGRKLYIMEEREFTDNPAYTNAMFVIDADQRHMAIRQLGQHFMQVRAIDPPDRDTEAIVFRSEFGLQLRGEAKNAIWLS